MRVVDENAAAVDVRDKNSFKEKAAFFNRREADAPGLVSYLHSLWLAPAGGPSVFPKLEYERLPFSSPRGNDGHRQFRRITSLLHMAHDSQLVCAPDRHEERP